MTQPSTSGTDDTEDSGNSSVGDQLRIGREANELTVQDIAARLHLDTKTIRALETSRFEDLGASAYVRGYIRNYAHLIERDPEPLIRQFDASASDAPPVRPHADSRPATQASSSDNLVKAVTYSIIALLVILLGIWWQTQYHGEPENPGDNALAVPAPAPTTAPVLNEPRKPNLVPVPALPQTPEPPDDADTSTGNLDPVPNEIPAELIDRVPAKMVSRELAQEPFEMSNGADDSFSDGGTQQPADFAQVVSTDAIAMTLELGLPEDLLVVKTRAEAWLEIYDASGTRLHFDLVSAGRRIAVTGERPYRLLLGNSPTVVVQYQDTILDLTPFSVRSVAHFHVGAEGKLISSVTEAGDTSESTEETDE